MIKNKKSYFFGIFFLSLFCTQLVYAQPFMSQQAQEQAYEGYFNRCMVQGEYKPYIFNSYSPQDYCKGFAFSIIMSMMDYYPSAPLSNLTPSPQEIANCKTLVNLYETGRTTCNASSCDSLNQRVQACKALGS
jgi:hypothetical protein